MPLLDDILKRKRIEIRAERDTMPLEQLSIAAASLPPTRDFVSALTAESSHRTRVIAEIKRRSPSGGLIREPCDVPALAGELEHAGAVALSCLTDTADFGGRITDIERIRQVVKVPILRKDFLIDPWQIWQSRYAGADAVLLIAEALPGNALEDMTHLAHELGLATLVELHQKEHLDRCQSIVTTSPEKALLGINNRDLTTMQTDVQQTIRLVTSIHSPSRLVSESGINCIDDIDALSHHGVHILLIGEFLMRQPSPGTALGDLLAGQASP